jgi:hypothetical protein
MLLDFSSITIFILATTTQNSRIEPQDYKTYYESRILPITETWGSFFPNLFFVFGTNQFDYQFLTTRCVPESSSLLNLHATHEIHGQKPKKKATNKGKVSKSQKKNSTLSVKEKEITGRRKLIARTSQMKSKNVTILFNCLPVEGEGKWRKLKNISEIPSSLASNMEEKADFESFQSFQIQRSQKGWKALYIGNCTGEYFGAGPTCRCQETLRFYLNHLNGHFKSSKWMIFMDDDVYYRPFSLQSFLSSITTKQIWDKTENEAIALISSDMKHEFTRFKDSRYSNATLICKKLFQSSVYLAQPAMLNR